MKRRAAMILAAVCLMLLGLRWPAHAAEPDYAGFASRTLGVDAARLVLGADDGVARPILVDGKVAGYLGSTWSIARSAGYSGRPIDIAVLVDSKAVIRGALLVAQQEPVLTLGIAPERIESFVTGFVGYDLNQTVVPGTRRPGVPDAIAGATISSGVIRSATIRTARTMAAHYGLIAGEGGRRIDMTSSSPASWADLVASKAVSSLHVMAREADDAIGVAGTSAPDSTFVDLHAAVIDPPAIGAGLLGEAEYSTLAAEMSPADHAIFIAANGLYSFKGTAWRRSGSFERIEIAQGERTIALLKDQHRPVQALAAAGAPEFREMAVFILPRSSGFDAAAPFRLSLIAAREDQSGQTRTARFMLDHALPDRYLLPETVAPQAEPPLWEQNWRARIAAIVTVAAMLLALYVILIFQNQIAARPRLYQAIRLSYLVATVIVLGIVIGAQLSVVHVLTFVQAVRGTFSWETFLLDPVIFIIWGWVAVALLFWGRVYCGWLCPFGALQELINKLAQRLGVKQITVPFLLHERLWPIKYIIFLGLFGVSMASMTMAFTGAEVEPFKTVVTLRFMREWPFIVYALGLLAAGVFIERFFCRYLCPLGAALAIPARLRMFEWLKRRPQCGRECRICSTKCPVQAIHPEGHINPNECVYCLNCQTLYYNEHICPPLKARAARRVTFTTSPSQEAKAP